MNKKINKKAYVFVTFVVILTFFALLSALLVLNVKYKVKEADGYERLLGVKQAEIFKMYQKGENARLYAEQAAKIAARKAVINLAINKTGCGIYHGYSLWSDSEKECFPKKEVIEANYKKELKDELKNLLFMYEDAAIPLFDDYKIFHGTKLKIIGASSSNLVISTSRHYEDVLVTHYYVPFEKDFSEWSTGENYKDYPNSEIYSWCVIPENKRGFYEEVKCQGSGVDLEGNVYSYKTIRQTKQESPKADKIKTATNTEAIPHKTIAVVPDMIPFNSKVAVKFENCKNTKCCREWEGDYAAEDTGFAMKSDWQRGIPHIDLYVGIGKESLKKTQCLPSRATLSVRPIGENVARGENTYKLNIKSRTEIDYSFDEYDELIAASKKIAEEAVQQCYAKNKDLTECMNKILSEKTEKTSFKWSFECEKEKDEKDLLKHQLRLCAESKKYSILNEKGIIKPVLYKIAVFAGDAIPPSPVENIKIADTPEAEESITISFDANKEQDIEHYEVYYSEKEFSIIENEGILGLGKIENDGRENYAAAFKIPEDAKPYFFAAVAADTSGNRGLFEKTIQGESKDDLNPGPVEKVEFRKAPGTEPRLDVLIIPAKVNEDNSELADLSHYTIYLRDTLADSCSINEIAIALAALETYKTENLQFTEEQGKHKVQIILPGSYNTRKYCLVAIAEDEVPEFAVKHTRYSLNSAAFVDGSKI